DYETTGFSRRLPAGPKSRNAGRRPLTGHRSQATSMKIGVLSDTHNFLDPKIPELFAGVSHILHAGDIGLPWILTELEAVAPVTAVAGNTDDPRLRYDPTRTVELAGRK